MLSTLIFIACVAALGIGESHRVCKTSHLKAFEATTGPVPFNTSPLDSFEASKLIALNQTAWEGWYFDSVSLSGSSGVTIAFLRDPTFSVIGHGNLYIFLYAVWENGTTFNIQEFVDESKITDCAGSISGSWTSTKQQYSFNVSKDLKSASFTIKTPFMTGEYKITSLTGARYADGSLFPTPNGLISLTPNDYWTEGIPAGKVTANFTINSTPFQLSGFGGHGRHYGTVRLDSIIKYWTFSRAAIGPYAFVLWRVVTKPDNLARVSGVLTEHGQARFATLSMHASTEEPYLAFTPTYDGITRGSFEDRSTGYQLDFVAPREQARWVFTVTHSHLAYEMPFIGGDGFGGFVDKAEGGLIGKENYHGVALTQQNQMASEGLARLFSWNSMKFIGTCSCVYNSCYHFSTRN